MKIKYDKYRILIEVEERTENAEAQRLYLEQFVTSTVNLKKDTFGNTISLEIMRPVSEK